MADIDTALRTLSNELSALQMYYRQGARANVMEHYFGRVRAALIIAQRVSASQASKQQ